MAVAPRSPARGGRRVYPVVIWVVAGVLAVTGVLAAIAWSLNDRTEHRLLREQLQQAGSSLEGAAASIQQSLSASATAGASTQPNVAAFRRTAGPVVGGDQPFRSISLWMPGAAEPIDVVGARPVLLDLDAAERRALLANASTRRLLVVNLLAADKPRLGFVMVSRGPNPLLAYGESALPAHRTALPQAGTAYRNVDYALYLGRAARRGALIDASTTRLPLEGSQETMLLPFGNRSLRLDFASRANLAGWLSSNLYWIIALSGAALAALAGFTLQWIATRRDRAAALAAENAELYREQRSIAVTLQRSLLPAQLGGIPDVEVAARYEPAVERTEVGGDWYDAIPVDGERLFVVVGDVSGHGIKAAATMASLRFAARAYVAEGCDPAELLAKLGMLLDVGNDAEFATVLCALLHPPRSRLVLANAGHPSPMLVDADGARYLDVPHGPPIGVPNGGYRQVEVPLAGEGTLLAFTDGLIERRGESLDAGLARLFGWLPPADTPLADLVSTLAETAARAGHDDDLAILGVRWTTTRT
jgi:serine phosphatase RsbU (regulator of sigma subunit)